MSEDDLPPPWISDLDLCRLIEKVTKRPATLTDAKAWRRAIERERLRRSKARSRKPLLKISADDVSFTALMLELLASVEGQIMITVLLSGGSLAADSLDEPARSLYDRMRCQPAISYDVRTDILGLYAYANEKAGLHGRRVYAYPDPAHALPGQALAALNAATPGALIAWRDRLYAARRSPAVRPSLIGRLRSEGADAMRTHPDLDLARPMSGPTLGLWPVQPPAPAPSVSDPDTSYAPPGPGKRL